MGGLVPANVEEFFSGTLPHQLHISPETYLVIVMRENSHQFFGRGWGSGRIEDPCRVIECAEGTVLAITVHYGGAEFIHGHCRRAMIDRWGMYCADPFRRASDAALTRYWAEPLTRGMFIFRPCRLEIVTEQEWMRQTF